jgi:hypothetical protein
MQHYQLYFSLGSIAVIALWLLHDLGQQNFSPRDFRAAAGIVGQHTIVMGVVYVITLGIAMVGARLATI